MQDLVVLFARDYGQRFLKGGIFQLLFGQESFLVFSFRALALA